MPSWVDFELDYKGSVNLIHSGKRIHLKIPAASPTWQLKIRRPIENGIACSSDYIVIADN
jgi:hypothetical protein